MNEDQTEFTVANDPTAIAYVKGLADAYASGAIQRDSLTGSPDSTEAYSAGKLVFGARNPSFLRYLKDNAPEVYQKTGVSETFRKPGVPTPFEGQFITVPTMSKNAYTASVFARFLTNDANQLAWAKDPNVVVFPSTSNALNDPFFSQPVEDDPLSQARAVAAKSAQNAAFDSVGMYLSDAVNAEFQKQLQLAISGEVSPEEALKAAQDKANQTLRK